MTDHTSAELAQKARQERRQIDLDPIVLVLLGIGIFTGARAIRGYGDGGGDQERLDLAVAAAVLVLAWVRPVVLRRRLVGDDPQVDDLQRVDDKLDHGDRVAVWLVIALGAVAVAAQQEDVNRALLIGAVLLVGAVVLRILIPWHLKRNGRRRPEIEGYLTPVLTTVRPTRLVLLWLGAWSVLAGLADDVPREGRLALLLFGALLLIGAFLDGLVARPRRRTTDDPPKVADLTSQIDELRARVASLEAEPDQVDPGQDGPPPVPRPLLLVMLVNLAALAAAGVALYSALFDNGQQAAEQRLLVFAGLTLLLAFVGDRIRSLTISKDSISINESEDVTGNPVAGGTAADTAGGTAGTAATPGPETAVEQRLQLANFEELSSGLDLTDREVCIISPKGVSASETATLLRRNALPIYVPRKAVAAPAPKRAVRTLKITGKPRAAHKDIVEGFFRQP